MSQPDPTRVLVTGATGYVGGRLVPPLLDAGHDVVCLVRDPSSIADRPWRSRVTVRQGDLLDPSTLEPSFAGVDVAYYLVHSMGEGGDFREQERQAALNFRTAAEQSGVGKIVYLGGLGDGSLSKHLASRQDVGAILADGPTPVAELRAAVIIGSGSLSFELLRNLTDVLPVMTTPRWVRTRCQPIAIADVLALLQRAASPDVEGVVEIGGPDVLTYEEMMRIYAREAGLSRRLIIPVPVLSPGLSSLWIGLVTPLPAAKARPLVSSLRNEVTVEGDEHLALLDRKPIPFAEAVRRAIATPAGGSDDPAVSRPGDPEWSGGRVLRDIRVVASTADQSALAAEFMSIGGDRGYYGFRWAWGVRAALDRIAGGPGMRRGRPAGDRLEVGNTVDFWRVDAVEPGRRLLLRAEMRLPGTGTLEFLAEADGTGSRLIQRATFRPRGLLGRLYWMIVFPFHRMIFGSMARRITRAAELRAG